MRLPKAGLFKPQQRYKRSIGETFKDFPPSSFPLLETLLAIDPGDRGTATAALNSEVSFDNYSSLRIWLVLTVSYCILVLSFATDLGKCN